MPGDLGALTMRIVKAIARTITISAIKSLGLRYDFRFVFMDETLHSPDAATRDLVPRLLTSLPFLSIA